MGGEKEIMDRLDRVAAAVENSNELNAMVKEHDRALRGHNNTPGLVAMVKSLADVVTPLVNDVKVLRTKGCFQANNHITWRYIVEQAMTPVITSVIVGVILYFVLR